MTTVINTPGTSNSDSSSGMGLMVGVILAILVIVLFFIYGLPAIRNNPAPTQDTTRENDINVDVNLPDLNDNGTGGTEPAPSTQN